MTCKLYVHTHTNTNATKESVLFSFFLFFKTSCWFCVRSEKSSAVHGKLMCRYSGLISHLHNVGIPSFFCLLWHLVSVLSLSVFLSFIFSSSLHGRFIGLNSSHSITQQNAVMAIQVHIFLKNNNNNKHNNCTNSNLITNKYFFFLFCFLMLLS